MDKKYLINHLQSEKLKKWINSKPVKRAGDDNYDLKFSIFFSPALTKLLIQYFLQNVPSFLGCCGYFLGWSPTYHAYLPAITPLVA